MQFITVEHTPGLIIMNKIFSTLQQRGFYYVFDADGGSIRSKEYLKYTQAVNAREDKAALSTDQ